MTRMTKAEKASALKLAAQKARKAETDRIYRARKKAVMMQEKADQQAVQEAEKKAVAAAKLINDARIKVIADGEVKSLMCGHSLPLVAACKDVVDHGRQAVQEAARDLCLDMPWVPVEYNKIYPEKDTIFQRIKAWLRRHMCEEAK